MRRDFYILIQSWMISDLKLKGDALLVYALIHGFTVHGKGFSEISHSQLADRIGSSRRNVINAVQKLEAQGLLKVTEVVKDGLLYKNYTAVVPDIFFDRTCEKSSQDGCKSFTGSVKKVHRECEKISQVTGEKTSHLNKNININKNKEREDGAPSLDAVRAFARAENLDLEDAERLWYYYESVNWVTNKGLKIKRWRAAFKGRCKAAKAQDNSSSQGAAKKDEAAMPSDVESNFGSWLIFHKTCENVLKGIECDSYLLDGVKTHACRCSRCLDKPVNVALLENLLPGFPVKA